MKQTIVDFPKLASKDNLTKVVEEMGSSNGWKSMFYGTAERLLSTFFKDKMDELETAAKVITADNYLLELITDGDYTEKFEYLQSNTNLLILDQFLGMAFDEGEDSTLTNIPV